MHIPGTDTLNPGDFLRLFVVGRPYHMAAERSGRRQYAFKFQAGYDVGRFFVAIGIINTGIIHAASGSDQYRPGVNGQFFGLILKNYGVSGAEFFTGLTFAIFKVDTIFFINGVLQGNRLGVFHIGRLAFAKPGVIFVEHLFGALFSAHTASDALFHVNIPGMLQKFNFKVAFLPGDIRHF